MRLILRGAILVMLLLFIGQSLRNTLLRQPTYDIESYIKRYRVLDAYVDDTETIGLLTDTDDTESKRRKFIMQYTLAPTVIDPDPACCARVIADLTQTDPPDGYIIAHDFGNGLFILQPAAQD